MKPILYAALTGYVVAAIHAVLTFVNKRRAAERITVYSLGFGFAAHTGALALDWARDGRYPLADTSEAVSFLAWTLVIAYWLVTWRHSVQALGALLLPVVSVLVFASQLIGGDAGLIERQHITGGGAAWLFPVHTTLLLFAYASFFVAFAASIMYLWQERELRLKKFSAVFHRLPSLTTVDDIGSTAASVGFTLLTLGIVTGVIWSQSRRGRVWHNDPIEFFALLTWVLYLTLLHYRVQWRGRKAAWLGVAGFTLVVCTFLGAVLLGGFHVVG
ncbi:MAG TPA: cytochrome c biogenesis protein CcsA [Pyrinomonadaceae bacterium]|nr:cytochrome c biogenesis protein CcsA [Pyrinomonadaceae bacterium]